MTEEVAKYKAFVEWLSDNGDGRIFLNSDPEHALVVLEQIFKQSNEIVRIFAKNLCQNVGNEPSYIAALSDFIERGGRVRILLNGYQKELALNSNLYKRLAYYKSQKKDIVVKISKARPYRKSDIEQREIHFTIGDEKAYRIETDTESRTAECSMNNPEVALGIANFFDKLFIREDAQEVDILSLFGYDE